MRATGLRSRWSRWPVTLAVVCVIIAGGAAAVAKWPHARWWLVVVMAAAAAVMPCIVTGRAAMTRDRTDRAGGEQAHLSGVPRCS
jgi:hypothetical protein